MMEPDAEFLVIFRDDRHFLTLMWLGGDDRFFLLDNNYGILSLDSLSTFLFH